MQDSSQIAAATPELNDGFWEQLHGRSFVTDAERMEVVRREGARVPFQISAR
jgi:hypothetical protein